MKARLKHSIFVEVYFTCSDQNVFKTDIPIIFKVTNEQCGKALRTANKYALVSK